MPKISIIIPVHNCEATIADCVRSVQAQTITDWELILANNASTDNSVALMEEMARDDSRIRVIDVPQKGVSNARNAALDRACGDFIAFIDGDDTVDPDYLAILTSVNDFDLVICGYKVDHYKDCSLVNSLQRSPLPASWHKGESKNVLLPAFENGYFHLCCNKLLRRSIIENHHIRFEHYPINEDYIFTLAYLRHASSIAILPHTPYHWIRYIGQQTGVDSLPENMLEILNESHLMTREFLQDNKLADHVCFFSYELLAHKYYNLLCKKSLPKKKLLGELHKLTDNTLVKASFRAYKPIALGAKASLFLMKMGWYRLYLLIFQRTLI